MGVLSDLATSNPRNGDLNSTILRWTRRASIRVYHRWIHLVLLYLYHYSRPCRHLDGTILSLAFDLLHFVFAALRKSVVGNFFIVRLLWLVAVKPR